MWQLEKYAKKTFSSPTQGKWVVLGNIHAMACITHFVHCVCFSNDGVLFFPVTHNSIQPYSVTTEGNQGIPKEN